MRLSKFSKKWIAYICAIALVVAGFAYAPATTSAAVDPADLDYTMVTAGDNTIGYSIVSNTIVGSTDPWYGDGGVTFQMIYSGDNLAADTTVEINGVETAAGGVVNMIGNGLVKLNPTLMDDDAYTRVDITTTTGSAYFYIKKGNPSGGETTEAPTGETTEAPTGETVEPTTEDPGPQQLEWTELFDGIGEATVANTSTDTAYGATFEGFVTDNSWGGDSVWQGQAKKAGIAVTNGSSYKLSVDLSATPAKNMRIQALTGGQYTEKEYAVDGDTHVDFYFTAKANDVQIVIAFGSINDPGTYDIEIANMIIEEGEEPTTEAPTGETESQAPVNPYDDWVNTERNLALLGTPSDTGVHREGNVSYLNDGEVFSWDGRDGITTDNTPGSFDITLDKAYDAASIDQVAVYWRCSEANFYPSEYEVQFGYKGTFSTVATVSSSDTSGDIVPGWADEGRFVTHKDFTSDRVTSSPVDTVRIYITKGVPYGAQAREVAVFSEDPQDAPEQPQAAAPASVQGNSPDYGAIAFSVTPGEDQDGYKYNVYAGDTLIGEGVDGNQEYVAYGFNPGDYTLKAVSIVSGMDPSDPVYSDTITVADPLDLFASDKNKAVGGAVTAVSSFYNDDYTLESSQCAVDGTPAAGEGAAVCIRTGAGQAATIDIDLQKDYDAKDLESFVLAYTNPRTYAANTQIGISADGEDFVEVANSEGFVPTKDGQLTANLIPNTSNAAGTFRYVRINLSGGVNGWGYCVNQIGVIVDDGEQPSTEAPSESPSVEPSTEAPSVEPSTEAPSGDVTPDTDVTVDGWTAFGDYYVYTGSWGSGTAKAGVDADDSSHIAVQQTSSKWSEPWITQVSLRIPDLTARVAAGEEFTVEWPVKAANNDGKVVVSGNTAQQALTGALQTVTGKLEIKDEVAAATVGMGWVGLANPVQFYQPTVKDSEGNVVYPPVEPSTEAPSESPTVEPSTEAPSESPTVEPSTEAPTVEPSTEAPTEVTTQAPTQEPTTQAPTQKPTQAPTVKPTTPQPVPVIRIPDKAKVKKAVKKKKSAKKIKVKIKKIKGAKGYQVAVYKTKKKAKKNKKALVKKYTKKTKLTIKSKKFKKKKKLYVKVRAYTLDGTVKVFGAWSKPKKTKKK
ncbi:MAG TPA: hypothetical protein DCR28_01735 [Eubacterium sp.]|nr:hypothetical protein [Eubacterium sp.]